MAKTKAKKTEEVQGIVDGFKNAKSVVFADISSLKVNDSNTFRTNARKEEVSAFAAKKTLLRLALKEAGVENVDVKGLSGSVTLLFGLGDAVAPAKVFEDFRKDHETMKVLGGLLDGQWMSAEQITALAKLPSKQQLIAQVVGTINAPLSGFVNALAGNLRGLVTVLTAIKDSKAA